MSKYYYKGVQLSTLFASGSTSIPNYSGLNVSVAPSQNSPGVIQNDIGYKIAGTDITNMYPILANSSTFNAVNSNTPITVPSWCTSITAVIKSKNGAQGAHGPNASRVYGIPGNNANATVLIGINCGPINTDCNPQYNNLTAYGGPGGAGASGGPGGPGGKGVMTTINQPYTFNSSLSIGINANSINLIDGTQTIVTCNYGQTGGAGNSGTGGSPGNNGNIILTNPDSGSCQSPFGAKFCHKTWPGTRTPVPGNQGANGNQGNTGSVGPSGYGVSNLAITNTSVSSQNNSITVYYFKK